MAGQTRRGVLPLFSYAHFAEHLSTALLVPLLPFIRDAFGLSYFQAGLVLSAHSITSGLTNLPAGWLADRVSLRWMMGTTMAGVSLATLAIGAVVGFWPLLFVVVISSFFSGTYHPVATSFISSYFRARQRGQALGIHMIGGTLGATIAPIVGGLIAQALGWRYAFIFLAIPCLASVPFYLRLHLDRGELPEEAAGAAPAPSGPPPGLARSLRPILLVYALSIGMQLITVGATSLLPIFMVDRRLVAPAYAAMMLALIRGGGLLGAPAGGWVSDHLGRKQSVIMSLAVVGPLLLSVVLLPVGPALIIAMLALGLAQQFKQPGMQSLVVESVPRGRRSTALGIYFFFSAEVRSMMVPFIGLSMDLLGVGPTFTGLGIAAVVVSVLALAVRGRV
ncbi:MAG: MFS transporter [Chloroflexi bacterium]|nr:MFS transporter [Chloroflexota bacterium]